MPAASDGSPKILLSVLSRRRWIVVVGRVSDQADATVTQWGPLR